MVPDFHKNIEQHQAPAFFVRGPSPFARLVFFAALSIALMATDSRLQYLTTVRENLMTILHPLQVIANAPLQFYRFTNEYFSTHHRLLNENEQLRKQALAQEVKLQRLNALALDNANLRALLQASQNLVESTTLAEIMHVGRDSFSKKIVVNRGTKHHIVAGAAVVDATGVIGQVTRTYLSSSEVTLITDKSLAIPVQIERNGLRAIAFGHGRDNTLDLPYLPANVDIRSGDKLITSGIDGVYPAGLAVATVAEMQTTQDSPFARIVCVPTGEIESNRQVLIVSIPKTETVASDHTAIDSKKKPEAASKPIAGQPPASTITTPANSQRQKPAGNSLQQNSKTQSNTSSKPHAPE